MFLLSYHERGRETRIRPPCDLQNQVHVRVTQERRALAAVTIPPDDARRSDQ
jgi:hypothetical protein